MVLTGGLSGRCELTFHPVAPVAAGNYPYQFFVSRAGGGSSDSAAINAAVTKATNYALNNQGYAEVCLFDVTGAYLANDPPVIGGATFGNALIPLPVVAGTVMQPTVKIRGASSLAGDQFNYFLQDVAQQTGTVISTTRTDGTNDATNGPAFMIGGPWDGYGETGLFSNMFIVIDGIQLSTPFNGTYGGFGFWGMAKARMLSGSYMPRGVTPSGQTLPQWDPTAISNQWTIGLLMPAGLNNDLCTVDYFTAYAATYGFMPSEHTHFHHVTCNYNIGGISPVLGGGNVQAHPSVGEFASLEANIRAVYPYFTGINSKLAGFPKFLLGVMEAENNTVLVYDPTPVMTSTIGFQGPSVLNGYLSSGIISNGGSYANKLIATGQTPGPVASPAAAPATTVAWVNAYYRDAWITVALDGGHTFTSLSILGTAQPNAAGAGTYTFMLPSGQTYTPVYAAGTLTHTVTLL